MEQAEKVKLPGRQIVGDMRGAESSHRMLPEQGQQKPFAAGPAPALPEDEEFLRGLGVSDVIPREGDVLAAVRERHPQGVDAVLDLVSYAPGAFDGALKAGGRVASPNGAAGDGSGRTNVMASPTTENLERLAGLLEEGVEVPIQETYELARVPEALAALGTTHTRGKLAIRLG